MTADPKDVTDAELRVLQALWALGLATIRELRDELYPRGETSEYATVQKLLERLEAKRFVRRSRETIPHTFAARVARDELVGRRLNELAESLCDGSFAPIVSHLVQNRRLKAAERKRLQELFRSLDAGAKVRRDPS